MELLRNSNRKYGRVRPFCTEAAQFFSSCVGYKPTRLESLPVLAARLGLRTLWAKLETERFGLCSFKILGAKWALHKYRAADPDRPLIRLITATDGNHGRAVARLARQEGLLATIYVPQHVSLSVVGQIAAEGADVVVVPGTYDDSVEVALEKARCLGPEALLLSDTSADESDRLAEWTIMGYETIFAEVDAQLSAAGEPGPDMVLVQIGVGGLAAAAARFFRSHGEFRPELVGVEPTGAAAALQSAQAGELVRVEASSPTIMTGLNAGLLSAPAWPDIKYGFDWFVAIEDDWCLKVLSILDRAAIPTRPTGAAALAAVLALAAQGQPELSVRDKKLLVIVTEGIPQETARI